MTSLNRTEAARRIVGLNAILAGRLAAATRTRLVSEQRTLWEAQFHGEAFEMIARLAH